MTTTMTQLGAKMSEILDAVYPVGSVYMSVNATSPTTLFGGTWERLKDTFLLAAGDTYAADTTGGEARHTLTKDELPSLSGAIVMHNSANYTHVHAVSGVFSPETHDINVYATSADSTKHSGANSVGRIKFSVGNDNPHNNMPPYLAVYMWKRTA